MSHPPRTPAESFATILLCLAQAVAARMAGGCLSLPLIALIIGRIRGIKQRFARLAARIGAGLYVPRRRSAAPRRQAGPRPRRPNPLPQTFAWLLPLVPGAAAFGSQLEHLFRDPEMAALMAAAPEPMGRALRPLCRMLGVRPPPVLATPRPAPADPPPARPPPARLQAAPAVEPPAPGRPQPPRTLPRRGPPPPPRPARLRGPRLSFSA